MKKWILLILFQIIYSSGYSQDLSQVLANYNKAIGLGSRRNPVSLCLQGELVLNLYGKDHVFPFRKVIKDPDKLVTTSEFEGRQRVSGFDGEKFWVKDQELLSQGRSIDIIQSRIEANLEGLAKYYREGLIVSVEKEKYENSDYLKVTIRTKDNYTFYYFLSTETNLVEILQIPLEEPSTHKVNITEYRYSDYRQVDGISYPFKKEYYFNHQLKSFERILSMKVNCDVDDKRFLKP